MRKGIFGPRGGQPPSGPCAACPSDGNPGSSQAPNETEILSLRRLLTRWTTRRRHVYADWHGKAERHLSAGLARRRYRPHLRHARLSHAETAAVALGCAQTQRQGRLTAALVECLRFNVRFRDELLNAEIFYSLREALILIEGWRRHYNTVRPHSSLDYRPSAPEALVPMDQRPTMHYKSTWTTQSRQTIPPALFAGTATGRNPLGPCGRTHRETPLRHSRKPRRRPRHALRPTHKRPRSHPEPDRLPQVAQTLPADLISRKI